MNRQHTSRSWLLSGRSTLASYITVIAGTSGRLTAVPEDTTLASIASTYHPPLPSLMHLRWRYAAGLRCDSRSVTLGRSLRAKSKLMTADKCCSRSIYVASRRKKMTFIELWYNIFAIIFTS